MSTGKKVFLFVHRWLGFVSGLVVFVVSITGCLFCFQDEIQDALYNWRHVPVQQQAYLTPSVIKQKGLQVYPKATAFYTYYFGRNRPAMVYVSTPDGKLMMVYINPYTGRVLHAQNYATDFFSLIKTIHLYLLLPPKAGQWVVGVSVLLFVVLLITGIILWWPKRKVDYKRSLTIKWNGRWRRVNYDLHNVLGFYACLIALVLAVTGLAIAFPWVLKGMYLTANGGKTYAYEQSRPQSDSLNKGRPVAQPAIDKAFASAGQMAPDARMYLISEDPTAAGVIAVTAYPQSFHYDHNSYYYFDQYTGRFLKSLPYARKSAGLKLSEMNYDIHVGQIAGLPGKIIAFVVSLISASLPVTGFMVWLGKRNKPRRRRNNPAPPKGIQPKFRPRLQVLGRE